MLKNADEGNLRDMFQKEDNTYNDMRKNSVLQWLNEQVEHGDLVNKHGAKLAVEHIEYLNDKIKELERKNELKEEFLKKLKGKSK